MPSKGERLRGGAQLMELTVKEAVFVPEEALSLGKDCILLRIALDRRDAVVRLPIESYASEMDDRNLWEIVIDSSLPKKMSQPYPRPTEDDGPA